MILGFAHLAINVDDQARETAEWLTRGYQLITTHSGVPNHPSKRQFLDYYQPQHDLLLLKGENLWSLELTHHGRTQGENEQIEWAPSHITLKVSKEEITFLRHFLIDGLGFKEDDDKNLYLHSRLPGWSCIIKLNAEQTRPIKLDALGPTCLAFYSNRIEEDSRRLHEIGAEAATEVFNITLGAREMKISMMRAPGGPLIELISPKMRTL